jgi:diaminopimelate decarboxylase
MNQPLNNKEREADLVTFAGMSLQLSHQDLLKAAQTFGTPLYVYHAERIHEQYSKLQHAFVGTDARFFYAAKALTNINILKQVRSTGCSVDCSSINEVKLAFKAGFAATEILYTSNNISFDEIEEAVALGVSINIDSLSNLEKFGKRFGHSYPVGVRLRPNIMAGGNLKISTGHAHSKFGIPVEQLDALLSLIKSTKLHIRTLHIHTGSEIKEVSVFVQGVKLLLELAVHFPELEVIDLGGGFKVPYKPGEQGTDIDLLGQEIGKVFREYTERTGRSLQVWFEPGKYMVSEAGYFIVNVTVLKDTGELLFAGVNSGLNHLIRPMFYDAYHHIENITNPKGHLKTYQVVGNICETDNFAVDRELPEIREGDLLAFYNAGAYGFEMASQYNSRYRPAEVLFHDNNMDLIRRREVFEDLLHTQILLP